MLCHIIFVTITLSQTPKVYYFGVQLFLRQKHRGIEARFFLLPNANISSIQIKTAHI